MTKNEKDFWKFVKETQKEVEKWPENKRQVVNFLFEEIIYEKR